MRIGMHISIDLIIPFFIASFVLCGFQYFRLNPERRVLNLRFGLMVGAIALTVSAALLSDRSLSIVFLALALFWFGLSVYLLRFLPPPRH